MLFSGVSQTIKNDPRLNSRNPPYRIDLKNFRHVLGEIEHHGYVTALSGERSSTTPAKDGGAIFPSHRNGRNNIVGVARENYSDGNLAIVRSVGSVESAGSIVEANVATHVTSQRRGESACIHDRRLGCAGELGEVAWHVSAT